MAAIRAFKEPMLVQGADLGALIDDFDSWTGRCTRYEIYSAFYENTMYRKVHSWASQYLATHSLYKATRAIYNPVYRSCEFFRSYVWGGPLDASADEAGSLPIVTDYNNLRPFIAQLWRWSNFAVQKDIIPLRGAMVGDVILRIVEDQKRAKLYFEIVPPQFISELVKDAQGNVKGYTLVQSLPNPSNSKLTVIYKEVCTRAESGLDVIYRTYLNDKPFAWFGVPAVTSQPYGFVPMVHIKHLDVGDEWGRAEMHSSRGKLDELNHLASLVGDHAAQSMRSGWLLAGVTKPKTDPIVTNTESTVERPEPIRDQVPFIYGGENARPWPLIADLDYAGVTTHYQEIMKELERDHPELKFDSLRASGTVSGDALLVARQPAEKLVEQRRAGYDNSLVRLQQMALSIGGLRGYFAGINEGSYERGELAHSFGPRPVFEEASMPVKEVKPKRPFMTVTAAGGLSAEGD